MEELSEDMKLCDPYCIMDGHVTNRLLLIIAVLPGVYNPHSYSSRVEVEVSPRNLQPLPPVAIRPAGPPSQVYDSDSAESLQEIPISSTLSGNMYSGGRSPHNFMPNGNLSGSTGSGKVSGQSNRGHRHKKRLPDGDFTSPSHSNSGRNLSLNGASLTSFPLKDMPSTEIPPPSRKAQRRQDVPPLDLSSFNEDSDENSLSTRKKKSKRKKQISKI